MQIIHTSSIESKDKYEAGNDFKGSAICVWMLIFTQ